MPAPYPPGPALPLPPPAHEAPLPPARLVDGVRVLVGVPYAALPGVRPLELDLYLPASGGAVPVVLFLHGGGWRLGSRRSVGPAYASASPGPFERLAHLGIAVASADYRLSGEACWPAQLHDAKAAVRWLRSRSDEIGLDPERVAVWGESAGGHLAALLGLTGAELDGEIGAGGPSNGVTAVVTWYAPTDLATIAAETGADPMAADSREAQLLGAPLPTVPQLVRQASPLSHVSAGAPPFLILHGRDDHVIACSQSERLRDALQQAGGAPMFRTYPGAGHLWLGSPTAAAQALEGTVEFLVQQLVARPLRRLARRRSVSDALDEVDTQQGGHVGFAAAVADLDEERSTR